MDFARQLEILQKAQHHPALLTLAMVDLAFSRLSDGERNEIKKGLLAAALPHSFESTFLAEILQTSAVESDQLFKHLARLKAVEPLSHQRKSPARVQDDTRLALREHLWRSDCGLWTKYSHRAQEYAAQQKEPAARIEGLYHLFGTDPATASEQCRELDGELLAGGRVDLRQALTQALEELAGASWLGEGARAAAVQLEATRHRLPAAAPAVPRSDGAERRGIFISYRHDSPEHTRAVRQFAERLRLAKLPVEMDQLYLSGHPGGPDEGWPKWSEYRANKSEAVLVIASSGWFEAYGQTGAPRMGFGAATEAGLFRQAFYKNPGGNARVRFVELDTSGECAYPAGLQSWHRFRPMASEEDFGRLVKWLRQRLAIGTEVELSRRTVYLAESSLVPDPLHTSLLEELRNANWEVLPNRASGEPAPAATGFDDMSRSVAFIQLLHPVQTPKFAQDKSQYETAVQIGLKTLRFLDPDKDFSEIEDPEQLKFLTGDPLIRTTQFDQFKKEVFQQLEETWDRLHQAPPVASAQDSPPTRVIRVILRCGKPQDYREQIRQALAPAQDISSEVLDRYEPDKGHLLARQQRRACHGFLLVCDTASLRQRELSTHGVLRECQEIQLSEKDRGKRPPVGVLFWNGSSGEEVWQELLPHTLANVVKQRITHAGELPLFIERFLTAIRKVAL